ncbi:MAG: hypothetical protein PHP22_09880 [Oscillospiraceae bacterium]|nr:hypothetical protein [Oscillospiraceae bacterium]
MDELIRKWVWMETMNYALDIIRRAHQRSIYPDYESYRDVPCEIFLKNIFSYALKNWKSISPQGGCSGHDRFSIGYWFSADSKGVSGEYKSVEIKITWATVKSFIAKMLEESIDDRQIDLLELLAKEAQTK